MKKIIPSSNSDYYCRKLKPEEKPIDVHDSKVKGLVLRVTPKGAKQWILRYHYKEGSEWKQRKTGLGSFRLGSNDEVGFTVSAARKEAERIKYEVKHNGADPVADRRKRAVNRAYEKASLVTVHDLLDQWASVELINRKDCGAEARRMMNKDVIPYIGNLNIKDVRKGHITEVTDRLLKRGVNRMAKVVFSLIRQMFRFALSRDLLEADPTAFISKKNIGGPNIERDRILNELEIKELAGKLASSKIPKTSSLAIWIVLATCCRVGELLKARWIHIDWERKIWSIPSENSKNQREHNVFLSNFSVSLFRALHEISGDSEWCYPSIRGQGHICSKTITKQVSDRQRVGLPYSNRTKQTNALLLSRGIWKPHDLRRTGATLMNSLGVLPEVAERCLNHTEENRVKRIYQRYGYESEMREAWEKLGILLGDLVRNEK